ncbi:tryptophan halogenase family protein [Sphingomonas sp. Y38-1Y]|uniref:tryptophan halogenase family protein n=1 Tax=Sphingomonas sp. Y38-1Y TaxID=3078265 RepID=UPI0028E4537C|nr:tryptophan halogenase family protein [Sphingomonas sp. Y38-1Y]
MIGEAVRRVVVVGGGLTGWSAAAALRRRLPQLDVAIVPVAPPADALADRMPATLPSILAFYGDLGLAEADAVARTGSGFRLGTRFEDWVEGLPDYVHAYGSHGEPVGTASFHQHWVRAARGGAAEPFDAFSAAATLGREGRFVPPEGGPLGGFEHGLFIDPPAHAAMLRAFARHLGVREVAGELHGITMREDGFVAAIETNGGTIEADLFVDCTGPAARLRGALGGEWLDWREWLRCDRLMIAEQPPVPAAAPLDEAIALPFGWRWRVEGLAQTSIGIAYASDHATDDQAAAALGQPGEVVALSAGSFAQPWRGNVVAIGDAATRVEPLEWTNLHLAHSAIDRLVTMMPGRDCAAVEVAEFNRQGAAEAMRVRDFLALHYLTARRPEPFWQPATPPPSLAHTLGQFAERGRLPHYEEETFARDSWLAVLLGQGVLPRRTDPLIEAVPPGPVAAGMARHREAILAAARRAPTHAAFVQAFQRQVTR